MDSRSIEERIANRWIVSPTGCWEWQGWRHQGYGKLKWNGRNYFAHRIFAFIFLGLNLADRKVQVCHKCDNPPCVNPQHLFLGNAKTNAQDASRKGRLDGRSYRHRGRPVAPTHCKKGHELSGSNLYLKDRRYRKGGFERVCIACQRGHEFQWYERQRARSLRSTFTSGAFHVSPPTQSL